MTDEPWFGTVYEEIGCGQQSSAVTRAWDSEDELVEFIADGRKPSEKEGIGGATFDKIFGWIEETHPDAYRSFYENNEAYATEFVASEASDIEDIEFDFAFVCPRCGKGNPLEGDPADFKNRPFACVRCRWVSCLLGESITEYMEVSES